MEKFLPVTRSEDGKPVRYLIVDDSWFRSQENLARMVETFGGQVIGEAGDGVLPSANMNGSPPTSF